VLGLGADERVDRLAALERDDRGDRLDTQRSGDLGVLVDVDLGENDLAESTRTGVVIDLWMTSCSNVASVTSTAMGARYR